MEMVQKIGVRKVYFMDMTFTCANRLPGYASKTVVVPVLAFLRQLGASFEFMHMPLFFRFTGCFFSQRVSPPF
jgi:hypothetical protein